MKRNTLETISRMFNATSTDGTRIYIQGVHCKLGDEENNVILEATDGYILNQTKVIDDDFYNLLKQRDESIIICNSNTKMLKFFLKEYINKEFDTELSERVLTTGNLGLKLILREFPKTETIINKKSFEHENCFSFGINIKYLKKLMDSIDKTSNKYKKDEIKLTFSYRQVDADNIDGNTIESINTFAPIKIESTSNKEDNILIIMPVKV